MEEIVVSITKKEAKNKLNLHLSNLLMNESFKLRKSDGFLIRKSKEKAESIYFRIVNYWPLCQEIEYIGFDIRFDKVEEIVNPFLAKYNFFNIEYTKTTSTIGDSFFFNEKVIKDTDVDNFIKLHISDITNKILEYFKKHNNMNEVNEYLKKIIIDESYVSYDGKNLLQSLTLMKLCHDLDFDTMKIKYRQLINPSWEHYQEMCAMYDDLVEYLSKW